MKEIKKYIIGDNGRIHNVETGEWFDDENVELVKYSYVEQLQARIKELESDAHINEIKAQGIEWAVEQAAFDCVVTDDPVSVLEKVGNYADELGLNMTNQKLTDEEYQALCRFFETVEDEGTFDIGKLMIKTLSHKKAIVHIGFGRYQITDYGLDVIATMNFED